MVFADAPLVVFVVGLAVAILLLVRLKLPAFLGLIISTFVVGLISPQIPYGDVASEAATAFGDTLASVGIPILMAAIIGKTMLESGAAERIIRAFTALTGEEHGEYALFGSGFVLAIPVFFANVFYLLAPLARSMRARVGHSYTLFIVVICAAAATTHVFVPPTPGPLAVAGEINANLGTTILVGLMIGAPTATLSGLVYGKFISRRVDIPLRDAMGTTTEEVEEISQQSADLLPGVFEASLPILLAIVLVGAQTVTSTFFSSGPVVSLFSVLGDPNFALTVAAMVSATTFYRIKSLDREAWSDELTDALKEGGNIAAIVAAGGAFGGMLAAAGVGEYIAGALQEVGLGLLITAWIIAAAVRIAQGSATVAMLTTAGIVAPLTGQLTVNPAYLVMVIGAGGNILSWYNDGGFWIITEIGGLTQAETLKTWTVVTTLISIFGLVFTLAFSQVLPLT
ncbi:GntP family permease [Halococcus hamelinensis]|uniref:Gluconate permease gntP n=1 Tax=Halococcus hamelinensis 100A6 TaxID=1132509 RepID=M0M021_9EURY|nr:gluconate:H+ symporter [Halococcus hamelinensis]EMA37730.1 gluconate permease gntP [Halococcus hamelinensis 100A6]